MAFAIAHEFDPGPMGIWTINIGSSRYSLRWGSTMPYEISLTDFPIDSENRDVILAAIEEWNASTDVTLRPARRDDPAHVEFVAAAGSCSTFIGRPFVGVRKIGCDLSLFRAGHVMHEIGHAFGLLHEHQRPDRGDFLNVDHAVENNHNYKINPQHVLSTAPVREVVGSITIGEYDCGSIMHYGFAEGALTAKAGGCATAGQRLRLSPNDISAINAMAAGNN